MDCTGPLMNMGCNGGYLLEGLYFVEDEKPAYLSSIPYTGQMQRCREPFDIYPSDKIDKSGLNIVMILPNFENYVEAL